MTTDHLLYRVWDLILLFMHLIVHLVVLSMMLRSLLNPLISSYALQASGF